MLKSLSFLLSIFILAGPAWSDTTAQTRPAKAFPWQDQKVFQECGPECLNRKAIENLSQQILTSERRIDLLQSAFNEPGSNRAQILRENVSGYCPDSEITSQDLDLQTRCLQRFTTLKRKEIRKIRAKMGDLSSSVVRLNAEALENSPPGQEPPPKAFEKSASPDSSNESSKSRQVPQMTYLIQEDDLNGHFETYLNSPKSRQPLVRRMNTSISVEYQEWLESLSDPAGPAARVSSEDNQVIEFVPVRFKRGRVVYVPNETKRNHTLTGPRKKLRDSTEPELATLRKEKLKEITETDPLHQRVRFNDDHEVGSINRQAFQDVRNDMVETINKGRPQTGLHFEDGTYTQAPTTQARIPATISQTTGGPGVKAIEFKSAPRSAATSSAPPGTKKPAMTEIPLPGQEGVYLILPDPEITDKILVED